MLNPPPGLSEDALRGLLAEAWHIDAVTASYQPLGFGTHHWSVRDRAGADWFVNLDRLADRRRDAAEPLGAPLARLRAALGVPRALRDHGFAFAVAPEPDQRGEVVRTLGEEFAVSVYPYLSGESFQWASDGWTSTQVVPAHPTAVLAILADLHTAPEQVRSGAGVDDFAIPVRDVLEGVIDGRPTGGHGPFTGRAGRFVADHADLIRRLLGRYDELAALGRAQESRFVLTHGEPHPGNTMRVGDRYVLIDWDTAMMAPPERDLWDFDPAMTARHTTQSGLDPDPAMLDLYRLRWDLTEIALYTAQFHRPHIDSENERASWGNLVGTLGGLVATGR